jgi:hypothetical protein
VSLAATFSSVMFAVSKDPTTMSNAGQLQGWFYVGSGLTIAPILNAQGTTPPSLALDSALAQSIGLTATIDTTAGTARGQAVVSLFDDGGGTPFLVAPTAVGLYVAKYNRTLICSPGPYNSNNVYKGVCKSLDALNSQPATLVGNVSDAAKPVILWADQNGRPALKFVGATSALIDNTSTLAARVMSGNDVEATVFTVCKTENAAPGSVLAVWSMGKTNNANAAWYLANRNGTNLWRSAKIDDANTAANNDGGALDTAYHVITLETRLVVGVPKLSMWIDGVNVVNATTQDVGATTLDSLCWGGLYRNSATASAAACRIGEQILYSSVMTTGERQEKEAWLKARWGTP